MRTSNTVRFWSCLIAVAFGSEARAEIQVGRPVPEFSLPAIDGERHSVAQPKGQPLVLLFGELYNQNTLAAIDELTLLARRSPLDEIKARYFLVVGTQTALSEVRRTWKDLKKDAVVRVLHDRKRAAFEDYGVKVLPTLVVVDASGRLAAFASGYPLNFADVVTDALLYAAGKVGRERLERSLRPEAPTDLDEGRLKALRTARMGAALAKRELWEMAVERFETAIKLDATLLEARLGLAGVRLQQGRVQEAADLYEEALAAAPANVDAHAGMARVEIKRDQIESAERRLKEQVALHPLHPELYYLLGAAYEKRGATDEALSAYKRAAHILLERSRRN